MSTHCPPVLVPYDDISKMTKPISIFFFHHGTFFFLFTGTLVFEMSWKQRFFLQAWLRRLCGCLLRSDLRNDWNVIVGLWENSAPSYLVAQWLSISVMQEDAERKRQ